MSFFPPQILYPVIGIALMSGGIFFNRTPVLRQSVCDGCTTAGVCTGGGETEQLFGCLPDETVMDFAAGKLPEIPEILPFETGKNIFAADENFGKWCVLRAEILENLGVENVLPVLFNRQRIANQGQYNSCAAWGFDAAYNASIRYNLLFSAGCYDDTYNPMYQYSGTTGGKGGRTLSQILHFNFDNGLATNAAVGVYPALSGNDNLVGERCCNAVSLPDTAAVKMALRAGIGVFIGNSVAVSGCKTDGNGVRLAVIGGSWSHSTALCGYANSNGFDYWLWRNSHSCKYTSPDKFNAPPDFCWFDNAGLDKFLSGCGGYGGMFAILPASISAAKK